MDTFWDLFFFIGQVSLLAVAAVPLFLVILGIYLVIYRKWRVWQADQVKLREATFLRLELDAHGLGGHVVDLLSGAITDLDQGPHVAAQKKLASLTGAQGYSAVATQVVEDEAPMVRIPPITLVPAQQDNKGDDW